MKKGVGGGGHVAELANKLGKEGAIRIGPPGPGALKRGNLAVYVGLSFEDPHTLARLTEPPSPYVTGHSKTPPPRVTTLLWCPPPTAAMP